jgi:DNA-binding transcriptional LysR family regulator
VTLKQLKYLVGIADSGLNITSAAERLYTSQPGISKQLKQLEAELGVQLFTRKGKSLAAITPAGREVIARARRIADEADAIAAVVRRFRDGWIGRVHIGTALTPLFYLLPPVLKKLRTEHPGIDIVISTFVTAGLVERVLHNTLDLAVATLPVTESRLRITPLYVDTMVAIFPTTAGDIPDVVTPDYVARQFLVLESGAIHGLIAGWLVGHAVSPHSTMMISAVEAVKTVVAVGLGMSIVPGLSVKHAPDGLAVRPLDPPLTRTLALIHHPDKTDDLAFRIARDALMELANIPGSDGASASAQG